jgi:chromatin assembly factor 1 subunit A
VFDYSYDSGDDWEEEEEGGEDILSDVDSEGEGIEEDDDDDGFLVPDDEVESIAASGAPSRSPSPGASHAHSRAKRKAEGGSGARKRRQITSPLIPFSKGPCYEDEIGRCDYEPFQVFRIQLFNGMLVFFIRIVSC